MDRYCIAFCIFDGGLESVEVGGEVVKDYGEDEEVIVGRPRPRSPVGQVSIDEE